MSDKEALQEIVYMVNGYVNNTDDPGLSKNEVNYAHWKLINNLIGFLEENVIHCAMDNNYK